MYTWQVIVMDNGDIAQVASRGWVPNPEAYIDYQDCKYVGVDFMLCGGASQYDTPAGTVALGGIDLVDLGLPEHPRPVHQIPMKEYVDESDAVTLATLALQDPELVVSSNAFWAEPLAEPFESGNKVMRFYFMTEMNKQANLLLYDVSVPFFPPESALLPPSE
jgi:hypothetical protein